MVFASLIITILHLLYVSLILLDFASDEVSGSEEESGSKESSDEESGDESEEDEHMPPPEKGHNVIFRYEVLKWWGITSQRSFKMTLSGSRVL